MRGARGCDWDPDYEMSWEWDVTVPPGVDLEVSTVNGGTLSVDGARGSVRATNVNGALRLTGLGGGRGRGHHRERRRRGGVRRARRRATRPSRP